MAIGSTGMALSGKFEVTWNGTSIERVGETTLPDTIENETQELVSNFCTRKEIIEKGGFQDASVTCFNNPAIYEMLLADKVAGTKGKLAFNCTAADGGVFTPSYDAKIITVGGPSGDVEGVMESFDVTFGIIARDTGVSAALGTQVYTE